MSFYENVPNMWVSDEWWLLMGFILFMPIEVEWSQVISSDVKWCWFRLIYAGYCTFNSCCTKNTLVPRKSQLCQNLPCSANMRPQVISNICFNKVNEVQFQIYGAILFQLNDYLANLMYFWTINSLPICIFEWRAQGKSYNVPFLNFFRFTRLFAR